MHTEVSAAVNSLRTVAQRVLGKKGSALSKIEAAAHSHDWDNLPAAESAAVLAALRHLTEHLRAFRVDTAASTSGHAPVYDKLIAALAEQAATGLPTNRKERYYTGTVLPAILSDRHCADLTRFLDLCGLPDVDLPGRLDEPPGVQILSEYSFAESRYTEHDQARFPDPPLAADTPDLVLLGQDWMVVVEAKMFHRPSIGKLNEQIAAQQALVDYWTNQLGLQPERVRHVLLLPEELAGPTTPGLSAPVITWQQVRDTFRPIGPAYWVAVLEDALARYATLASKQGPGNDDDKILGVELVEQWLDGSLPFKFVGCSGGLGGTRFKAAITSGTWRTQAYEVRYESLAGNRNWFSVDEFVQAVTAPIAG